MNSAFLNGTVSEPADFYRLWWQDSTLRSLEIVIPLTLDTVFWWTLFFYQVNPEIRMKCSQTLVFGSVTGSERSLME